MFKRTKYSLNRNEVIVYPWHLLKIVGAVLFFIFIFIFSLLAFSLSKNADSNFKFSDLAISFTTTFIIGAIFCLIFILFANIRIVFDGGTQMVYRKGFFGSRNLMAFADIAEITKKNSLQQRGFFIQPKGDRYGKGTFLSPSTKSQEFDTQVLPVLNNMIRQASVTEKIALQETMEYKAGQFVYYTFEDNKYFIKRKNLFGLIFILLIILGVWALLIYNYYFKVGMTDDTDSFYVYIPVIPLLFILAVLGKKIYFDVAEKEFVVKYWGFAWEKEKLENFIQFLITRKTHNGVHSGTDVRIKFKTDKGKEKKSSQLMDFKRTKKIEGFINETKFIINSIVTV